MPVIIPRIKFYGSQVGGRNVTPLSYTDSPMALLYDDIWSAVRLSPYLQFIIRPLWPWRSGELCELYPSPANIWSLILHLILVFMQVAFIVSIPFWFLFLLPLATIIPGVAVFWAVNQGICYILNGPRMVYRSDPRYATTKKEHEHEQWIFLNGVGVGRHWLGSNINRLALTFGRPVIGVHNKSNGILFDVIQCLIQRNFNYATQDIRDCYKIVKEKLYMDQYTKIVFILHSQGGIEGGMIIDWLLQEVPQDLLAKLEIYTFGNSANHFNNPHTHLLSQHVALSNAIHTTKSTMQVHYRDPNLNTGNEGPETNMSKLFRHESPAGKTIRYIEHYANTSDFVALWGVLHCIRTANIAPIAPRFMGRVFEHTAEGHQFNQHYMDNMFPLQKSTTKNGGIGNSGFEGAADESAFMDSVLEWDRGGDEQRVEREGVKMSYLTAKGESLRKDDEETCIGDISPTSSKPMVNTLKSESENCSCFTNSRERSDGLVEETFQFRVKDLSRLWGYRNGRSPKVDEIDVGIARMATI